MEKLKGNLSALGTMDGSLSVPSIGKPRAQDKVVTSSTADQVITPDEGYDYLRSVTILGLHE